MSTTKITQIHQILSVDSCNWDKEKLKVYIIWMLDIGYPCYIHYIGGCTLLMKIHVG